MKVGVHFSHFMAILSHFGIIIFDMTPNEMSHGWSAQEHPFRKGPQLTQSINTSVYLKKTVYFGCNEWLDQKNLKSKTGAADNAEIGSL